MRIGSLFLLFVVVAATTSPADDDAAAAAARQRARAEQLAGEGDVDAAIEAAEAAARLCREAHGAEDLRVAAALELLAKLHLAADHLGAACEVRRQALQIVVSRLGADHWRAVDARLAYEHCRQLSEMPSEEREQLASVLALVHAASRQADEVPTGDTFQTLRDALDDLTALLGDAHPIVAEVLDQLAALYYNRSEYDLAEPLYQRALMIRRRLLGSAHPLTASTWNDLGLLYHYAGKLDEAVAHLREALAVQRRSGEVTGEGFALIAANLAGTQRAVLDFAAAEALLREALQALEAPADDATATYAEIVYQYGDLCWDMRNYPRAEELYRRALVIWEQVADPSSPLTAMYWNNLGLAFEEFGDYALAESLFRRALGIYAAAGDGYRQAYANALASLAGLYRTIGDYQAALPLMEQAVETLSNALGPDDAFYAMSLANLGLLHSELGDQDAAGQTLERALAVQREQLGLEEPACAVTLTNLAVVAFNRGELETAVSQLKETIAIRRHVLGESHPQLAISIGNLGTLYRRLGRFDEAARLAAEELELTEATLGRRHPHYAIALTHSAMVAEALGHPDEAIAYAEQAMHVEEKLLHEVLGFTAETTMRSHLRMISGSLDLLLSLVSRHVDERPELAELALEWSLRRKTVVLDALCHYRQLRRRLAEDVGVMTTVAELRSAEVRERELALRPAVDGDAGSAARERENLRARILELEGQLHAQLPQRLADVDLKNVRARLSEDAALIEIARVRPFDFGAVGSDAVWQPARYLALIARSDDHSVRLLDLGLAEEIDAEVRDVRRALTDTPQTLQLAGEAAAVELLREVQAPLDRRFRAVWDAAAPASSLFVAPDGELNRLPLAMLDDGAGGYLIQRYRLRYLSSPRDLLRTPHAPATGTTVFAAPDFDRKTVDDAIATSDLQDPGKIVSRSAPAGDAWYAIEQRGLQWSALPGTMAEAAAIEAVLADGAFAPVSIFVRDQALESRLKALPAPRVLHLATHGFYLPATETEAYSVTPFDRGSGAGELAASALLSRLQEMQNPLLRSGLVLAGANTAAVARGTDDDGWLTAAEIADLDLGGTQLVVLSACETGLGDLALGSGVSGLRRALSSAGAENVVASLFRVPDKETGELMQAFYRQLADGESIADALRGAQLDAIVRRRAAHGAAHPFFWAGFGVIGPG